MDKIKKYGKWVICGIGIVIFITMVVLLLTGNVTSLDNSIYNTIILKNLVSMPFISWIKKLVSII